MGNVVSRERFKLVYNTSETVSKTVRSGHGVEPDGVPTSRGASIESAGYADGRGKPGRAREEEKEEEAIPRLCKTRR